MDSTSKSEHVAAAAVAAAGGTGLAGIVDTGTVVRTEDVEDEW